MESNVKKHWAHCTGEKGLLRKGVGVRGFTLVEIIFALAVLMVGLVGVMAIFPVGLDATNRAVNNTITAMLAQQQMENIRRAGFGVYTPGYYGPGSAPPGELFDDTGRFPGFSYVVYVTGILSNLRRVDLVVYAVDQKAPYGASDGTVKKGYRQNIFTTFLGNTDLE